jgi:hypothetical protein
MYLLQCGKSLIITTQTAKAPQKQQQRCNMSDVWDTKDGRRRVRRDPPTLEDAVLAAQGLAEDVDGQVRKMGQPKDTDRFTTAGRGGAPRTVVVERRAPRRVPSSRPTASAGYRGRI